MAGAGAGAFAGAAAAKATAAETSATKERRGKRDFVPMPLSFWRAQETFLQEQLAANPVPTNTNIKELECKITDEGRITYHESAFERLSENTKKMRKEIYNYRKKVPAYTQLLADCQEYFYPYFVAVPSELSDLVLGEEGVEPYNLDDLFADKYDEEIRGKWRKFKATTDDYDRLPSYKAFEELKGRLMPQIEALENNGRPLCVSLFDIGGDRVAHALACVLWKADGVYNVGFYDPLYFVRTDLVYKHYLTTVYILFQHMFAISRSLTKTKRVFRNLSALCIAGDKTHCAQYMINAEYCSIYVFYFFYLYAVHDFPTTEAGFAAVIRDTYTVEPALLRRGPCMASNTFRLVHIQFAMNTILLYTGNPRRHKEVVRLYNRILEETGYKLLTDDMLAHIQVKSEEKTRSRSRSEGGGRRRRTRRSRRK